MKKIKKDGLLLMLALLLSQWLMAQSPLSGYIKTGLADNLALKQKSFDLKQARQALDYARSYFLPTVTFTLDYSSGDGGRAISIPTGDLLNPVYNTLNQLTTSKQFPQISNTEENFFPQNFYDAKVRTSIPIYNTDLKMNRLIREQQVGLQEIEIELYRRQLVMDIKTAYFAVLSAQQAVRIYENALVLVNKNVTINESLLRNGKILPANLLRAKTEVERVKADINSAANKMENAKKYFNFLLSRPLDAEIELLSDLKSADLLSDTSYQTIIGREELALIGKAKEINLSQLKMTELQRRPKVSAYVDLGAQESNFRFNKNAAYYMVGVQLTVPIYQGRRNRLGLAQNRLDIQQTELRQSQTGQQLQLAADLARNDLNTATRNYYVAGEQIKTAQSYFNLVEKGFLQGVNTLLEYMDARNQLTATQIQQNIRLFEVLSASAKVERETAAFKL